MTNEAKLRADGSVTIPLDVRHALGLRPDDSIAFRRNQQGEFVVSTAAPEVPATMLSETERQRRREAMLTRIDAISGWCQTGRSTDEYMAEVREPLP